MSDEHFLDRTLTLIKEELAPTVSEHAIVAALESTRIVISSDHENCNSHSARTAILTAALLMARCGLEVWVDTPDFEIDDKQPPFAPGPMSNSVTKISSRLRIRFGTPHDADVVITLGDTPAKITKGFRLLLNCEDWSGVLGDGSRWRDSEWPFGAMSAAAMAAGEAFKVAMQPLSDYSRSPQAFREHFTPLSSYRVSIFSQPIPASSEFGRVDVVSGGAVTNAALYALLRVSGATGSMRVIETSVLRPHELK